PGGSGPIRSDQVAPTRCALRLVRSHQVSSGLIRSDRVGLGPALARREHLRARAGRVRSGQIRSRRRAALTVSRFQLPVSGSLPVPGLWSLVPTRFRYSSLQFPFPVPHWPLASGPCPLQETATASRQLPAASYTFPVSRFPFPVPSSPFPV